MVVKAIISDLDGVIRSFPDNRNNFIEQKYSLPEGSLLKQAFGFNDLNDVVSGKINDQVWRNNIKKRLTNFVSEQTASDAIDEWTNYSGKVNLDVLNLYRTLKNSRPFFLMTNATDKLEADLINLKLNNEFDLIINSSQIGFAKPDPEIFNYALDKLNLNPNEIAFIDDSIRIINKAKEMNFICHHYQSFDLFKDFCENNF